MKTKWKSFNIRMPNELIPIYDFLQNELNFFLSNPECRKLLLNVDMAQHRGDIWRQLRNMFVFRIKEWDLHNKTWHSYILFENLRRELNSKLETNLIWKELEKNNFNIDEQLFNNLHSKNCYPTRSRIANIRRANQKPELPTEATFNLDYTVSEKQFFRMTNNNLCKIKINKKEWIDYQILFPSSIDHNLTGKISKPR